jgi:hypothetical protein
MSSVEVANTASLDLSLLLGDWRNTNAAGGISRIVCEAAGDRTMRVRCYARIGTDVKDWGVVHAPTFVLTFDADQASAFLAIYDFGFEEVRLQANVKLGVLVVASLNRFRDDSGRSNYFDREFFYRTGA